MLDGVSLHDGVDEHRDLVGQFGRQLLCLAFGVELDERLVLVRVDLVQGDAAEQRTLEQASS